MSPLPSRRSRRPQSDLTLPGSDGTRDITWEELVERALLVGASDLHMHVYATGDAAVRARLDGVMVPWCDLSAAVVGPALTRMRSAAGLATSSSLLVGEGRIAHEGVDGRIDLRLTVAPLVAGGLKVAVRLPTLAPGVRLEDLGFDTGNLERVRRLLSAPDGLVLASGPVGSGKTTTLLAALDVIGGPGRSVVTVEDPVERVVAGADQLEVNEAAGFTYEHILRSLLRMDLDALLVGEIRDQATAAHAIQIAKAGRLVLSTLHAGSAAGTLARLHELSGLGALEVSDSVRGVIAQRLLRKVHQDCDAAGCDQCLFTGYHGRVAVHEVLVVDDTLRDALVARAPIATVRHMALEAGMRTFMQDADRWLAAGVTTTEEIERVLGRD